MIFRKTILATFVATFACLAVASVSFAADTSQFQAGRIIDDAVFTNSNAMSVSDIQNFLNSKVPNCDTNHAGMTGGTGTVYSPQFICLKNFYENPSASYTVSFNYQDTNCNWQSGSRTYYYNNAYRYTALTPVYNSGDCHQGYVLKGTIQSVNGAIPSGGISAAQIIYNIAQQYQINPEVLIVLLQKEQGLVTDTWPAPYQYQSATGYGCPDFSPCDQGYSGFSNQLKWAATMFHAIMINSPTWYTPYIIGNNYIQYNPIASCGGTTVNIQNRATQALYNYTPYQPNAAALAAGYGTGDGCSAYGNRNFWLYFNDWFGSTYGSLQVTTPLKITSSVPQGMFTKRTITASFDIQNTTTSYENVGDMMIAVRDSAGNNFDFGRQSVTIAPGATYHYTATQTFSTENIYTFSIANYQSSTGWNATYPVSSTTNISRTSQNFIQALPTIQQLPTAASELRVGKPVSMSFAVKNNSAQSLNLGRIGMAIRGPSNQNLDLPYDNPSPIAAGATYAYAQTFTPQYVGQYSLSVALTLDGGVTWNDTNFPGIDPAAQFVQLVQVKPSPSIVTGLQLPTTTPKVGQKVTLSFTVTNFGTQPVSPGRMGLFIRDPLGNNADPRWDNVTIQPNSSYNYSVDLYPSVAGDWKISIGGYTNGNWTNNILPYDPGVTNTATLTVAQNPTITAGISMTPSVPRVGQDTTLQFTIQNDGDIPASINSVGLAVRDFRGNNLDPAWISTTIAPHSSYVYSQVVRFMNAGNASMNIAGKINGQWVTSPIPGADSTIVQSQQVTILPSPTITQGITFADSKTIGSHTLTFVVTNYGSASVNLGKMGLAVRDPNGNNYDPLWQDFVIPANSSLTYSATVNFDKAGIWTIEIGNYNGTWNNTNPLSENAQIIRRQQVTIN